MKKTLIVLALSIAVLSALIRQSFVAWAAAPPPRSAPRFEHVPQEGKGCTVPKSWGQLKGVADRTVAFEDSSGAIRVVDLGPCMRGETQLVVKISRP
jgi:hypothetical protein